MQRVEQRSERTKFCHWTPIVASTRVRPYRVLIRAGFGLDLSGCTAMQPSQRRITEWLLPPLLPSFGEKNALIFPKSTIQNATRGAVLKESVHSEGTTPYTLHWAKKLRGLFGPREIKSSVQDVVAASCQGRMGSIQMPKVCFSQQKGAGRARCCSLGCLSKQQPGVAGPGWQED